MHIDQLRFHLVNGGRIEQDGNRYRLIIPPVTADAYSDAQIDDYAHVPPYRFSNRPPQAVRLRARFSRQNMKGTAGFGFWNHPFSRTGAVIAPPCNVWFFNSSPESDMRVARHTSGHGFKAAMLNSGSAGGPIVSAAGRAFSLLLKIPVVSTATMAAARAMVSASEVELSIDMTSWHDYELDWRTDIATYRVDGREVLRAPHPPAQPMGFAAWVDNYRATAAGSAYRFAYVASEEEQWLELEIMDGYE